MSVEDRTGKHTVVASFSTLRYQFLVISTFKQGSDPEPKKRALGPQLQKSYSVD
jgi:hypothetical protein